MTENIKKNIKCWDCQYFFPLDSNVSIEGYCRRYAPHSQDFFGLQNAANANQQHLMWFESAALDLEEDKEILLTRDGISLLGQPPTGGFKPISNPVTSFNAGGSFPFTVPTDSFIYAIQIDVTAMATWGIEQSENPYIEIDLYTINPAGDAEIKIRTEQIATDSVKTYSKDVFGDNKQDILHVLPGPLPISASTLFGWRINATSGIDDKVYKTNNIIITIYLGFEQPGFLPDSVLNSALNLNSNCKWSFISDSVELWCGEFKPSSKTVPPVPTIIEVE